MDSRWKIDPDLLIDPIQQSPQNFLNGANVVGLYHQIPPLDVVRQQHLLPHENQDVLNSLNQEVDIV